MRICNDWYMDLLYVYTYGLSQKHRLGQLPARVSCPPSFHQLAPEHTFSTWLRM